MRHGAPLLFALVLVAAGCGDDSSGETETLPEPTTATLAPPTTTTVAATTSTTVVATTTTRPVENPLVEAALEFIGDWSGQWNNTTFGSSGSVEATVAVDAAAESASLTLDLGGFVFGGSDPDPVVIELDLSGTPPLSASDGLFGDSTIEVGEDGTVTMTAHAVPGLGGLTMVVTGAPDPGGWQMAYTIHNQDGSVFAEGVMDLAPTS